MVKAHKCLTRLRLGERGVITALTPSAFSTRLMERGILPGCQVCLHCKAPFGDPLCINVSGCRMALRQREAALVQVRAIEE